jgi:hypothetical protein
MADRTAQRTDEPGYTPEADMRPVRPEDKRREGTLGGILIFALPMLILVVAFFMWWTQIGTDGPAIDEPRIVPATDEATPDSPAD